MRARYIGDPRDNGGGPEEFVFFGALFLKGEWREIEPDVAARVSGHSHFEVEGAATAAPRPERITDLDPPPRPKPRKAKP